MTYSNEVIGRRLHSGLVDRGISTAEFAERMGVSQEVVKNWINGRTTIGLPVAAAICDIFDWEIDHLCVRETA